MKLFILRLALFFVILLLGLTVFSFFLKVGQKHHVSSADYKLKSLLEDKTIDPEIMVFGSSVAEGGFNPELLTSQTDKTVFNAALSGRRIIDWSCIAFSFIDYTKNSKVIILDIFPNVFNETPDLYQPHEFYPYLNNAFVKQTLSPISDTYEKMARIPFYYLTQLNSKIIINSFSYFFLHTDQVIPPNFSGYKEEEGKYNKTNIGHLDKINISARSISLYEKLFAKAASKQIKIILVGMPVYIKGQEYYEHIDSVYKQGEVWSEKYANVEFINYLNDSSVVSKSEFFINNTHLNINGATEISTQLVKHLAYRSGVENK